MIDIAKIRTYLTYEPSRHLFRKLLSQFMGAAQDDMCEMAISYITQHCQDWPVGFRQSSAERPNEPIFDTYSHPEPRKPLPEHHPHYKGLSITTDTLEYLRKDTPWHEIEYLCLYLLDARQLDLSFLPKLKHLELGRRHYRLGTYPEIIAPSVQIFTTPTMHRRFHPHFIPENTQHIIMKGDQLVSDDTTRSLSTQLSDAKYDGVRGFHRAVGGSFEALFQLNCGHFTLEIDHQSMLSSGSTPSDHLRDLGLPSRTQELESIHLIWNSTNTPHSAVRMDVLGGAFAHHLPGTELVVALSDQGPLPTKINTRFPIYADDFLGGRRVDYCVNRAYDIIKKDEANEDE